MLCMAFCLRALHAIRPYANRRPRSARPDLNLVAGATGNASAASSRWSLSPASAFSSRPDGAASRSYWEQYKDECEDMAWWTEDEDEAEEDPGQVALPLADSEQAAVVEALKSGRNVKVNAVAGAGKTTTALLVADAMPDKDILLLTYNKRLRLETIQRASWLTNLTVHTYHSAVSKFYRYGSGCKDDEALSSILVDNQRPTASLDFDIFIIDEAQDMTLTYYQLARKLMMDNSSSKGNPQVAVVGDTQQMIYGFLGADHRFLTMAEQLYPPSGDEAPREWQEMSQRISYRLTGATQQFLNNVMLKEDRLSVAKSLGAPVEYWQGSAFTSVKEIGTMIQHECQAGVLSPDDIFILAPSVRSIGKRCKNPLQTLENSLARSGIPCYVSQDEQAELCEEVIRGKVVFSTFHQSKGMQRKFVVVMDFSADFFRFYDKHGANPWVCPNVHYVAATRASERLIVVAEEFEGEHLPYISLRQLEVLADDEDWEEDPAAVVMQGRTKARSRCDNDDTKPFSHLRVTDVTRFLPSEVVDFAMKSLNVRQVNAVGTAAKLPGLVDSNISTADRRAKEEVADVTGLALVAMYEYRKHGGCQIAEEVETSHSKKEEPPSVKQILVELRQKGATTRLRHEVSPAKFCELASWYQTLVSGYDSRHLQVGSWAYLDSSEVDKCLRVLSERVPSKGEVEFECALDPGQAVLTPMNNGRDGTEEHRQVHLVGQADIITEETLWEIKCVRELSSEHFLQLALYAFLWNQSYEKHCGPRSFRLLNARTGEDWEIDAEGVEEMAAFIIAAYYRGDPQLTDEEFLQASLTAAAEMAARPPVTNHIGRAVPTDSKPCRPYKCRDCRPVRSFKTKASLLRHQRQTHRA